MKISQRKYIFFAEEYTEISTVHLCQQRKQNFIAIYELCFKADMSCAQLYQVGSGLDHVIG